LNHCLLSFIFNKAGFNTKVLILFCNYLVGKKTQYLWNNFSSSFFNADVGVSQGSVLFPILSALYIYITLILHILKNHLKILKIPVSIFSFVDNGLLVAQSRLMTISNSLLFDSYQITLSLFDKFGLIMEYRKMEVFYFSRLHRAFNPPLLDLLAVGGPIL